MEKTDIKTKTYRYKYGFMIDIVETYIYEAWIYHKDFGVKLLMFGCPKEQQTHKDFLSLVEWNIETYIELYEDEYMN